MRTSVITYRQDGCPGEEHRPPRLSEDEYARAMAKCVKFCHDAVILDARGNILLAQRRHDKAMPGYWFIGGQMKPFTPITTSLAQVFKRETGLNIDESRFVYVAENQYVLKSTEADPAQDSWCKIFTVVLTDAEIATIRLDPQEYETETIVKCELHQVTEIDEMRQRIFTELWPHLT